METESPQIQRIFKEGTANTIRNWSKRWLKWVHRWEISSEKWWKYRKEYNKTLKLKSTIYEMKILLDGLSDRLETED